MVRDVAGLVSGWSLRRGRAVLRAGAWALIAVAITICFAETAAAGQFRLLSDRSAQAIVPVAVFGKDDRTTLPAKLQPYQEALGLLFNIRSRTVCTAFCVAEGMIATAAHCLYRPSGDKAPRLADFWFARNYDAVRDYARVAGHNIGAAAQNVLAGSIKLNVAPPIDATRDWALVRLSRPICKVKFEVEPMAPDDIVRQSQGRALFQLAYHRDFTQWRAAYSTPCVSSRSYEKADWPAIAADFSLAETLVLHTCDTGGGSSGSPLLVETANGPRVVGINVGTYVQSKVLMRDGQVAQRMKPDAVANTGVAVAAFADRLAEFAAARILMTATEIRELQRRLVERGTYSGPLDGTYGPTLRAAIEDYERAAKRRVVGIASEALLKHLRDTPVAKGP